MSDSVETMLRMANLDQRIKTDRFVQKAKKAEAKADMLDAEAKGALASVTAAQAKHMANRLEVQASREARDDSLDDIASMRDLAAELVTLCVQRNKTQDQAEGMVTTMYSKLTKEEQDSVVTWIGLLW